MKKLFMALLASCLLSGVACYGNETKESGEFAWSWWAGAPAENVDRDLRGCALGIGSEFNSVRGAQVSLCMNKVETFNNGAQVAIGYNRAGKLRNGCQVAFVNSADSAALQFGLLCFNKSGFLPFFVFFNFDKHAFGSAR